MVMVVVLEDSLRLGGGGTAGGTGADTGDIGDGGDGDGAHVGGAGVINYAMMCQDASGGDGGVGHS